MPPLGLLLLGGAAFLLAVGGSAGSSSPHSLRYFFTALSEAGQGLPWFIIVGYVDDQPIARYDSRTREFRPQAPWMEKVVEFEAGYWEGESQVAQGLEAVSRVDLVTLRDRFNQKNRTGQHIVQWMYGCEVGPEGQFLGGHDQYAYDGEDFLALDLETLTYTARVAQAQETKRRWDGEAQFAQYDKAYLEGTCVEWLRRYLAYGEKALRRKEAPRGRVSLKKVDHDQETLICRLDGFYPKEIEVTWMKDGEDRKPETLSGGVVPNLDGTYHTWLSIEVDPKEKDRYRCQVEHDSLRETLHLAWEEPASNLGLILGILGSLLAALILVGAGVACYMKKRKEKEGYEAASRSDRGSDASAKISIPA